MSQQESKATILLADDEEEIRYAIQLGLEMNGYEVLCAGNGEEVLELISGSQSESKKMDLIITDWQMPGMTSMELIGHLKVFEIRPPVLVISGFQDQSLVEEVKKQGCVGFIKKPFTISELIAWIEKSLEKLQENPNRNAARK